MAWPESRSFCTKLWKAGTAMPSRIPATVMVTKISISVNPRSAPRASPFKMRGGVMGRHGRSPSLLETDVKASNVKNVTWFAYCRCKVGRALRRSGRGRARFRELDQDPGAGPVRTRPQRQGGVIQAGDLIDDGEPESAAVPGGIRHPVEPLPHPRAFGFGNAGAGV